MTNKGEVYYTSNRNTDARRLAELYDEYMYRNQEGLVVIDDPLIEDRGVVHLGRKEERFVNQLALPESCIESAMIGDSCIGFVLYYMIDRENHSPELGHAVAGQSENLLGYIYLVCVDESYTRRGIGKHLAYRAMATFMAENVEAAILEIASAPRVNKRSKNLFERAGWKDTGKVANYTVDGKGVSYSEYKWINQRLSSLSGSN